MRRPLCILCICYVVAVMALSWLFPPSFSNRLFAGDVDFAPVDGSCMNVFGKVEQIQIKKSKSVVWINSNVGNIICYFPDNSFTSTLQIGNIIKVNGTVRFFEKATNPGQFDAREHYGILGYDFAMSGCDGCLLEDSVSVYQQVLYAAKRRIGAVYDAGLPEKYAGIVKAMVLGEKGDMDPDVKALYQQNGISHILAISALHITFIGKSFFALLRRLRLPVYLSSVLSMALVISFGVMTGSGASTVRSVIMFSLFLIAGMIGRTYDMITAMAVSAVALLIINPRYIYHCGFLLSFGAVMGIGLGPFPKWKRDMVIAKSRKEKLCKRLKKYGRNLISSLYTNRNVVLFTLPIQLYFFFTFSPYSICLNLIVVPLMGIVMTSGILGGIVGCFLPFCAHLILLPCHGVLWFYEVLCLAVEQLPGSTLILGRPALWQIVLYYMILLLWLLYSTYEKEIQKKLQDKMQAELQDKFSERLRKRFFIKITWLKKQYIHGILIVAIVILCIRPRFFTSCNMLDIGQGDCFVIQEKSGCNIMVDGGSSDVESVGTYRIIPYLKSQGISKLDYVFVSHADLDHISGVVEMLQERGETMRMSCLVLTKFALSDEAYSELVNVAKERGVRVLYVAAGDVLCAGETTWTCLYPGVDEAASSNDQSMVLLMECGEAGMLFTGDLTEAKESCVSVPDVDILKVGHHGSRYSTTEAFLKRCKPEVAIISAGKDSVYGHPHAEVLERLRSCGSYVVVTAENGAIRVRMGKKIVVQALGPTGRRNE